MKRTPEWVLEMASPNEPSEETKPSTLTENDYRLVFELLDLGAKPSEEDQKNTFLLLARLLEIMKDGSTFLPCDTQRLIEKNRDLFGNPGDYKPIIVEDGGISTQKIFAVENALSKSIVRRLRSAKQWDEVDTQIEDIKAHPTTLRSGVALHLSSQQWKAIHTVLENRLAIISGGPGTGKTSILVTLLRLLVRLGVDPASIALAAPTGKAASRMNAAIRSQLEHGQENIDSKLLDYLNEAQTLHRTMKYSGQRRQFLRDKENKIPADFIIIDEASMIDLELMGSLFSAAPEDAHIVLVGDARQLPSVDVGAVLRDLVNSSIMKDRTTFLEENFRIEAAGKIILDAAKDIEHGNTDAFLKKCTQPNDLPTAGLHLLSSADPRFIDTFLDHWFQKEFIEARVKALISTTYRTTRNAFGERASKDLDALFMLVSRARILCATRVWKTGTEAINAKMHKKMILSKRSEGNPNWLTGEPVMMTMNNYEYDLYNGDQGIVLRVRNDGATEGNLRFVFETADGYRAFEPNVIASQIEHAYAITIHKSQGSEYDNIAFLLPEESEETLSRELIYTAITRARRSVTILGRKSILRKGIERRDQRVTRLSARIEESSKRLPTT